MTLTPTTPAPRKQAPQKLPPMALTMGDAAGIGPELALQAWKDRFVDKLPKFVFYADVDMMRAVARSAGVDPAIIVPVTNALAAAELFDEALPVIPIPLAEPAKPGAPTVTNGPATILAIRRAVADVAAGRASAVVTNPIAKSVLYGAGFEFPGHTEYLGALAAEFWPGEPSTPVMMLASSQLRVVPLTIHVPLKDVPSLLTFDKIVETARIMAASLKRDFGISNPRIAVAGLNPHAGEDGALGSEDAEIIRPAVEVLRAEGLDVTGPHAADTMFHDAARKTYDAALAMYHDQGLIPIKTLSFDEGVNATIGLPFVRTSPDHGTAFAIAGKGLASAASLKAALKLAGEMSARRSLASAP
ncbi:4-hydroxythreonine-4-phosphate dehydrogenase PdxA [Hyphomicrobium sp. ghe19]|uniref:4-hydroxythreonine-4-phosphate dehydrogenase PdxA n=1 Tax=Hyphomicrobium sp. ghe19 TaxID=2682968 RepID=UPI001366BD62|nr:4-hydroxythreonine-4-phosphate dehydrogenase 1 [Hyphomicrobium sp. ghe19]